jgi:hypothetical protein
MLSYLRAARDAAEKCRRQFLGGFCPLQIKKTIASSSEVPVFTCVKKHLGITCRMSVGVKGGD